jgi:hypothetical protein
VETSRNISIAREAFARIQASFPQLTFVETQHAQVDLNIEIPAQPALRHAVNLNLQGDELHFHVCSFWVEWFPCGDPSKVEAFVSAVSGFLSGRYRLLEHYRGSRCVRAELQEPKQDGWNTVACWSRLHIPIPWSVRREVRRNA